jgi:hypothetical protein
LETQECPIVVEHPDQETDVENHVMLFNPDPEKAYQEAQRLVNVVSSRCTGPGYLSTINGKVYPRIEWWASVSASLGLFPRVIYSKRIERNEEIAYEAKVEVHRNGLIISSGEAMCSNREARWRSADEYAIKSMAITRASGKSYRIPLSFLAVMAGLEVTPAEEIPQEESASKKDYSEQRATDKQIEKLGSLVNDDRLTFDEQTKLRGALIKGLTKSRASEFMTYLFGESVRKGGEWIHISEGVLKGRSPTRK